MFCPYGNRCLFRHEERTFDEVHAYHNVAKLLLASSETYFDEVPEKGSKSCSASRLSIIALIEKEGAEEGIQQEESSFSLNQDSTTGECESNATSE